MNQDQLNTLCEAYQNVDGATLHEDYPGNTGANDSGITKVALSWSDAVTGEMKATATFPTVPAGEYPWAGLWDGTVFIEAVAINLVVTQTIPFYLTVRHYARERASGN